MIRCTDCNQEKPETEYYKTPCGFRHQCKTCKIRQGTARQRDVRPINRLLAKCPNVEACDLEIRRLQAQIQTINDLKKAYLYIPNPTFHIVDGV